MVLESVGGLLRIETLNDFRCIFLFSLLFQKLNKFNNNNDIYLYTIKNKRRANYDTVCNFYLFASSKNLL